MESKPNGTAFDFGLRAPYQEVCARWLIMLVYALRRAIAETLIALEIIDRRSTGTDETWFRPIYFSLEVPWRAY
jgi:hypothetical protein